MQSTVEVPKIDEKLADACELVQKLTDEAPSEIMRFVRIGLDGQERHYELRVRLLRAAENLSAIRSAQEFAKQHQEDAKQFGDLYKEAYAHEIISRALCHAEPRERPNGTKYFQPIFVNADQLRQSFTEDECLRCLNMYTLVSAKYGGLLHYTEDEIDSWAARLGDAILGPFFISRLDSTALPGITLSLARRVVALSETLSPTQTSSPDSTESSPETSEPGTGDSPESLNAYSPNSPNPIPSDRPLTREDARGLAHTIFGDRSK